MRAIYDMSNLGNSRTIHTTGQSGHPYHEHYDDFIPLWLNGQYHPQLWDRAEIEKQTEGVLTLTP
jgi:penicillin amidase